MEYAILISNVLKTTLTFRSFTPLNRGAPRKRKKKADRRARACLVFPILWTLDPLSLGFNFYSLSPPSLLSPVSPCATELEASLLVRLSPPRFLPLVIRRRSRPADVIQARCTRRQCCLVLVCGTRRCTMRQQSGAAPLPAGDLRASPLTIISSLFLIFSSFFFFFYSVPIERGSSIRTDSFRPLVCGKSLITRIDDDENGGKRDNSRETYDKLHDIDNLFTINI